jgi:hypothetical protein
MRILLMILLMFLCAPSHATQNSDTEWTVVKQGGLDTGECEARGKRNGRGGRQARGGRR